MIDITPQLKAFFGERLKEHEPLSKHTNFRIGGPARWFVEAKSAEEIKQAIASAEGNEVPWFVTGGGSNTLASDEGFSGVVIQIGMRQFQINGTRVMAEAGVISSALARATAEAGLAGFEWAISLPGTIGGAVRGNAGCFGGEMKDVVKEVTIFHDREKLSLSKKAMNFGYRESVLKHASDIVLSVLFELRPGDPDALKRRLEEILAKRKATQPLYAGSAGCVFKNYDIVNDTDLQRLEQEVDIPSEMIKSRRISAGWLIDQLDLKGKQVGQAQISREHGNFIVNLGGATASDVVQLIAMVKMYARDRFGIQLQEEVQYLGF